MKGIFIEYDTNDGHGKAMADLFMQHVLSNKPKWIKDIHYYEDCEIKEKK